MSEAHFPLLFSKLTLLPELLARVSLPQGSLLELSLFLRCPLSFPSKNVTLCNDEFVSVTVWSVSPVSLLFGQSLLSRLPY